MRLLVAAICCLHAAAAALPETAAGLPEPVRALGRHAGDFWGAAPLRAATEILRQRSTVKKPERGIHFSNKKKPETPLSLSAAREIISWYGFAALSSNPEAIREFRQIISIDGKPARSGAGWDEFRRILLTRDDEAKRRLLDEFDAAALGDVPGDFGQILLLFTNRHIADYTFTAEGQGRVGAEPVKIFRYAQNAGKQAFHVSEGGHRGAVPLSGLVYLRENDSAPLRVTMVAVRGGKTEVRDEAEVDYTPLAPAVLAPVSLVHRRFVNGRLENEDRAEYDNWRLVRPAN